MAVYRFKPISLRLWVSDCFAQDCTHMNNDYGALLRTGLRGCSILGHNNI